MKFLYNFFEPSEKYYAKYLYNIFDQLCWNQLIYRTNQIEELSDKIWFLPITIDNYKEFIKEDQNVFNTIPESIICTIREYGGFILFDFSYDAIPSDPIIFKNFHSRLKKRNISPDRVVIINGNMENTDQYLIFCKQENIKNKMKIIGYDSFFYLYSGFCNTIYKREELEERIRIYGMTYFENHLRERYFLSLNRMPRPHRYALMLFFVENNLLDKGLVSFAGHALPSAKTLLCGSKNISHPYFSKNPEIIYNILEKNKVNVLFDTNKMYQNIIKLIGKCPIVLDEDFQKKVEDIAFDNSNPQLYLKSYLSIVTDTRFFENNFLFITEKVYKSIFNLHPFIYVGPPGSLDHLRKLGFETFSPYIDESYDSIINPAKRMEGIFQEIKRLCSLPLSDMHYIYSMLWNKLLRNYYNFLYNSKIFFPYMINEIILSKFSLNEQKNEKFLL